MIDPVAFRAAFPVEKNAFMRRKVFVAYCVWSVLLFIYGFLKFTDGRFAELAGERYGWFLLVFLATSVIFIGLGGILSWLAYSPKRKWASWCFIAFCTWRAIDSVWGGIRFSNDESGTDWFRLIFFPSVWFFLATIEWIRKAKLVRLSRHPKE